jgi:hypothetical protein
MTDDYKSDSASVNRLFVHSAHKPLPPQAKTGRQFFPPDSKTTAKIAPAWPLLPLWINP